MKTGSVVKMTRDFNSLDADAIAKEVAVRSAGESRRAINSNMQISSHYAS